MDIAQAYVQILPTTEGIKENLTSALSEAGTSAGQTAGSKMGSALSTGMKVGSAAIGAITAGVTAASGAFIASAKSTADYGDAIDKTSQKLGLSTKAYQEWDYVLNLAGTSMGDMTTGMKTLTNKLDDAKNGSTAAQEMFGKLGISMEQINSMSREELFAETIKGFQGLEDSTERAALANDLFGKSGQNLTPLFNQSSEATQDLIKNANELGMVMSEDAVKASADFEDSLTTLQGTMGGLKRGITAEFLPSITTAMTGITNLFAGNSDEGLGQIKEGVSQFIGTLTDAIPKVIELAGGIIGALGEAIIENLPELLKAGLQAILTLAQGISDSLPELIPTIYDTVLTMVDTLIDNIDLLIGAALQLMIGFAQGLINAIPRLIERLPEIITSIVNALINSAPQIATAGETLLTSLITNLPSIIGSIISAIPKIITGIVNAFGDGIPNMIQAGKDLLAGLGQGLVEGAKNIFDTAKNVGSSVLNTFSNLFRINSPSKVMMGMGASLDEGLATGIEKSSYLASDAMTDLSDSVTSAVGTASMSVGLSPSVAPRGTTIEVPRQQAGAGQQSAILMLDKEVLGRVVYTLNQEAVNRVGVNLAGGMA